MLFKKNICLFLIATIISSGYAFSQNTDCLALVGTFTNKKKIKEIKAYLHANDVLVDSVVTDSKKGFQFVLKRNNNYSIAILKPGFYNRLVKISTFLPAKASPPSPAIVYLFGFQLELLAIKTKVDDYWLDFPIANVAYDSISNDFSFSKKYTQSIKSELIKMGLEKAPEK